MNITIPNSPITQTSNVKKVASFSSALIIEKYKAINIDVKRHFDGIENIDLYECLETGYRFYYPFSTIGDAKFYEDISKNRKGYYSTRWEHCIALEQIPKTAKVLEVGAGFGAFQLLLKNENITAKGLELNPHAVDICKKERLDVERQLIQETAATAPNTYDVVCYFQVLEHICEINEFITASIQTLKKGGKLIIGVPNNNPYLFVNDKYHTLNLPPHHAGLWNEKSLSSLQSIFPLQLENVAIEPLQKTYAYFIQYQINHNKNVLAKFGLKTLHKLMPNLLKKIVCKFVNGRNILVTFKKT